MPLKKTKIQNEEEDEELEETEELEEESEEEPEQRQIKKAIDKSPLVSKSKTSSNERYRMVEVPVQMTSAFQDTESEKIYDQNQMLLKIANDIEEIKKSVA